jgi:Dirigent-like protein
MSKRILVIAGVLLTVVLASALVVAAKQKAQPLISTKTQLTVIEHAVSDTVTNTGKKGDTAGDLLTWHNALYNDANKKVVGRDQGSCIRIDPKTGRWDCYWTNILDGGQIMVQGPFYDSKNNKIAIVGGTGMYANARGAMQLKARKGGKEYAFKFNILP